MEYKHTLEVKIPKCHVTGQIPYMTIESSNSTAMMYEVKCHVNQKTVCVSKTELICSRMDYIESIGKSQRVCKDKFTRIPNQHLRYDRKCFFDKQYDNYEFEGFPLK